MNPPVRIVLADDHPAFRHGLRMVIEARPEFRVVAEAGDGRAALRAVQEESPDLVVLDLDMPLLDGLGVARSLRGDRWPGQILFVTMHKDEDLFREAAALDVKGYVLKDSAVIDLVQAIEAVAAGRRYFSPALADFLLSLGAETASLRRDKPGLERLTPAERRILRLIAGNLTSKEIAGSLNLSVRTVENHRANICDKLDLHGAHSLVKFAFDHRGKL